MGLMGIRICLFALLYGAATTTIRNVWGQQAADDWTYVVLLGIVLLFHMIDWLQKMKKEEDEFNATEKEKEEG